ncbi:MAG: hypothetical protein D6786_07400 [Gammaproteobacteria bacterium]|nr:MAG: hypothetical protein D6786_07400 [Gammaproteobacteria bacterium]
MPATLRCRQAPAARRDGPVGPCRNHGRRVMTIEEELLSDLGRLSRRFPPPPIRSVYLPEPQPHALRHTEFGMITLEDGSAGLYYAWLGEGQQGMDERYPVETLVGTDPLALAGRLPERDEAVRSLAMAAVNAVTASAFGRAGYRPPDAPDSFGALQLRPGDHLGMVGFFPPLIGRLAGSGVRLTVIEKKPRFLEQEHGFEVTSDPTRLRDCNKVLTTATILLNGTAGEILAQLGRAEVVVMVGPTAGFVPDSLFARGVTAIGGTWIEDAPLAMERLRSDEPLGEAARKTLIHRDEYPGLGALLA